MPGIPRRRCEQQAGKIEFAELNHHGNGRDSGRTLVLNALTYAVVGRRKAPAPGCTQAHTWRLLPAVANTQITTTNYFTADLRSHCQLDEASGSRQTEPEIAI